MTQHPITPPPELVQQWWDDFNGAFYEFEAITATVFQVGADQELEACCEWFQSNGYHEFLPDKLRADRRPKPPSLKEQALVALQTLQQRTTDPGIIEPLRRALESLSDD